MTIAEISVHELSALGASARIIDVRERYEWDEGHIAHATLVPLGSLPDHVDDFDGAPTFVVCRSGRRSAQACEFLVDLGRDVVNVTGGMLAWIDAGLDVAVGGTGV